MNVTFLSFNTAKAGQAGPGPEEETTLLRLTLIPLVTLLSLTACAAAPRTVSGQQFVPASLETDPAGGKGDTADDPAFWRHPADPARSLILATNKKEGLVVYALDGREVDRLPIGRINNVDLRPSRQGDLDLAIASNDEINAISLFTIARATGEVSHAADLPTGRNEPYGICQGQSEDGDLAGVTYKDGTVEIWQITLTGDVADGRLLGSIRLASQPEGCVFDEANGYLFIGEEAKGIWRADYNDLSVPPHLVDATGSGSGLVADVEGISIWRGANAEGWLVVSAQEEDRFLVYDRKAPHLHRGSFSISANKALKIDAVTHTDGLDIHSGAVPGFSRGLLIVQDDGNPGSGRNQNFKLVDWADVEAALGLARLDAE